MTNEIKNFIIESCKLLNDAAKFCFIVRSREFQEEAIVNLKIIKEKNTGLKEKMILLEDEDSANALLSHENMIEALINELKMWVALKDNKPNDAWDFLVNAQNSARIAMSVHNILDYSHTYFNKLLSIEKFIFSNKFFFSLAYSSDAIICSICEKNYDECEHEENKAYMGKICLTKAKKKEIKSISLITHGNPKNKKNRVLFIK